MKTRPIKNHLLNKIFLISKSILILYSITYLIMANSLNAKDLGFYIDIAPSLIVKSGKISIKNNKKDYEKVNLGAGLDLSAGYGFNLGETVLGLNLTLSYDFVPQEIPAKTPISSRYFSTLSSIKSKDQFSVLPSVYLGKTIGYSIFYGSLGIKIFRNNFIVKGISSGKNIALDPDVLALGKAEIPQLLSISPSFSLGYSFGISPITKLFTEATYTYVSPVKVINGAVTEIPSITYSAHNLKFNVGISFNF